jgi:hypothetical protein
MSVRDEAFGVLEEAEEKLRRILAQAVAIGDYDDLPQIAEWAKLLTTIVGNRAAREVPPVACPTVPPTVSENGGAHGQSDGVSIATPVRTLRPAKIGGGKNQRKGSRAKSGYPHFVREGESLVKIGWSKSEAKPYEHKAPRGVLRALLQALARVGSDGKRFTVEPLLPLKDPGGSDIPDYQVYLTLAWLRSVGLIVQHGRQGYSIREGINLEREANRAWSDLASR